MSYIESMFSLEGKTAVITGGGGTIAHAMAEAYLKAGANVSLWGHRSESIESAKESLSSLTGAADRIQTVRCDAFEEDSIRSALQECTDRFGEVHILVNAAGGNRGKAPFTEVDVDLFREVVNLNLIAGLVIPTKVCAAYWSESGISGCIINMASMSSYVPLSGIWAYNAAKSAVKNLTAACAKEFAPAGIRVNALAPGFFLGKQNRDLLIDRETGDLTPRGRDVIDHTPFGRFGDVSELAGASLFLASSAASGFVTGVTIPVDGGYLTHNI